MATLAESAGHRANSKGRTKETILVVDDEPSVRELLNTILARAGYRVRIAADAREALSIFAQFNGIDLIVSDICMPGMNGHRLLDELRRIEPRVRCILLSGDSCPAVDEDVAFLRKPFSLCQLLGSVAEALKIS